MPSVADAVRRPPAADMQYDACSDEDDFMAPCDTPLSMSFNADLALEEYLVSSSRNTFRSRSQRKMGSLVKSQMPAKPPMVSAPTGALPSVAAVAAVAGSFASSRSEGGSLRGSGRLESDEHPSASRLRSFDFRSPRRASMRTTSVDHRMRHFVRSSSHSNFPSTVSACDTSTCRLGSGTSSSAPELGSGSTHSSTGQTPPHEDSALPQTAPVIDGLRRHSRFGRHSAAIPQPYVPATVDEDEHVQEDPEIEEQPVPERVAKASTTQPAVEPVADVEEDPWMEFSQPSKQSSHRIASWIRRKISRRARGS